jgi:hypothetical protein
VRVLTVALAAALVAACEGERKPAVDPMSGGKKAIERAQDVSKTLEAGAQRSREAENAATGGAAPARKEN